MPWSASLPCFLLPREWTERASSPAETPRTFGEIPRGRVNVASIAARGPGE